MLRLPPFSYFEPRTVEEATTIAADHGERAFLLAGGTDLLPKLKRRQVDADVLVALPQIERLHAVQESNSGGFEIGAAVTLAEVGRHAAIAAAHPGYSAAAAQVSSPALREAGTIGGNLCVDTRCNYYDMSQEWRAAIGFCMKKDGDVCLVASGSTRCWAVSSSDTAPAAIALGATVVLAGPEGERELPASDLFRDDGIDFLAKQRHEVLVMLRLPPADGLCSSYVKVSRRGSIDFPLAGAAAVLRMDGPAVEDCRIVLTAVGSRPVVAGKAAEFVTGKVLDQETAAEAGRLAAKIAKPLDNTDGSHVWRKRMVGSAVAQALLEAALSRSTAVPS